GSPATLRSHDEVRPQLPFGEEDQVGIYAPQNPPDGPGEIEWPIDDVAIRETLSGLVHPGVGRGRNHALPVRMPPPERCDDLLKQMNLADADAVKPTGE